MADLTLPLIGLTALAGYFFNKDGKTPREVKVTKQNVNKIEEPNGDNIYQSRHLDNVNADILERSLANYNDSTVPSETGILPPIFNTYSITGQAGTPNVPEYNAAELQNIKNFYSLTDVTQIGKTQRPLEKRPMFTEADYLKTEPEKFDPSISLLTGLPIETKHNNMVPFFGSRIKQNVENFSNEKVLDLHTGNKSTYQPKQENSPLFGTVTQDIYGTPIFTDTIYKERYTPSNFKQSEKPMQEERISAPIAGTIDNKILPQYKDINELRVGNRLQQTYEGRTITGQMGSVRGAQSISEKRRPDTFYEKSKDHWFRSTGAVIGTKADENYNNLTSTARSTTNIEYAGPPVFDSKRTRQRVYNKNQAQSHENETPNISDSLVQDPKRYNFENDWIRNSGGKTGANDYGKDAITMYQTERATTGERTHTSNVTNSTRGVKTRFRDIPKVSLKETLPNINYPHIKTHFDFRAPQAFELGVSGIQVKTTLKETSLVEDYKGTGDREMGMGYLVNPKTAKTTSKEVVSANSNYNGNPNKNINITSRDNYNNMEVNDSIQELLMGERPSGPQKFQIASGKDLSGEIKLRDNMLLKEDVDTRERLNYDMPQVISDASNFGTSTRETERYEGDTNRLISDLVNAQHSQNPYSIYGKK